MSLWYSGQAVRWGPGREGSTSRKHRFLTYSSVDNNTVIIYSNSINTVKQ